MKYIAASVMAMVGLFGQATAEEQSLSLTDKGYLSKPGVDVLVFSNWYDGLFSDAKISGVEMVHQGVRIATNGDVRLQDTPEQWDPIPVFDRREVLEKEQAVQAWLSYPDYHFSYSIKVSALDEGVRVQVILEQPLPPELEGSAGFNLEFIPTALWQSAWLMDDRSGQFPLYPTGLKELNGSVRPTALANGRALALGVGSRNQVNIVSEHTDLALFDGRSKAQNGWFVVRSLIQANKTGVVVDWKMQAQVEKGWKREPVIAHSQVGYHPSQQKVALLELDSRATAPANVELVQLLANGQKNIIKRIKPEAKGSYKRYQYYGLDFSDVKTAGVYQLRYQGVETTPFNISDTVYEGIWHPSLDIYFPVQMDHVLVNEAYRVWHGASHLDDARQAPVNHKHFDLYAQGPTTDTDYEPGEFIPGLNIGGWYDAGDYDIRTQTQYRTIRQLVDVWESFEPKRDVTHVDYLHKTVDLHVADGKNDLLQQIEHGTLALLAQYRAFGRAINGIIVPTIDQYTHLGDGLTMTDNLIYDSSMASHEQSGTHSGQPDDRWAFTSRSTPINYGAMAALASASRALASQSPDIAKEALQLAVMAWEEEASHDPYLFHYGNTTGGALETEKLKAAVELLITTRKPEFAEAVNALMPEIKKNFTRSAILAVRAMPYMDKSFKQSIRQLAVAFEKENQRWATATPFAVPITEGGWAGNGTIMWRSIVNYYLHKAFPEVVDKERVYAGLNYILGTHPDSAISFVSGVGSHSKKVAYGMNRADFSFIAGGVVPGILVLKPDLPENREDWPFFWGQNEYVVNMSAMYIFLAQAVQELSSTAE